jgi:hypothetical protein
MTLKCHYATGESNSHGPKVGGNSTVVKGWKLKFIDIRKANAWNQEVTRAIAYWRWILYRPSGYCHYFDVVLKRGLRVAEERTKR